MDRSTTRRVLASAALLAALLAYVAALGLGPGAGYAAWRDGWLANLALALPGVMCLARAASPGPNRLAAALFGLGCASARCSTPTG